MTRGAADFYAAVVGLAIVVVALAVVIFNW